MHIGVHYSYIFDNDRLMYVHTINYNFNGKDRNVVFYENTSGKLSDEYIRDIVFNDMRKYIKIYRK